MKIKKIVSSALIYVLSFSVTFAAQGIKDKQDEDLLIIPLLSDAQVFSRFDDRYPLMVNFFTNQSKDSISSFYNEKFGDSTTYKIRYGRLELTYKHLNNDIRVIVAPQGSKQEVDIIVELQTTAKSE